MFYRINIMDIPESIKERLNKLGENQELFQDVLRKFGFEGGIIDLESIFELEVKTSYSRIPKNGLPKLDLILTLTKDEDYVVLIKSYPENKRYKYKCVFSEPSVIEGALSHYMGSLKNNKEQPN